MPDLALFEPDIPGNTGTLMRLAACLDFTLHIIEPAGFRLDDKTLRRSGMDYVELAKLIRHDDWNAFQAWAREGNRRLILMTTKSEVPFTQFAFESSDIILMGRESSGAPEPVHTAAHARLTIPMANGARSLNQAICASITISHALISTGNMPV